MKQTSAKTVLLTRSTLDNAHWASELRTRGFEPIECACLETYRIDCGAKLTNALHGSDWIACTSRRSVDALYDQVPALADTLRLAAVGPATADRLRARFGRCDLESANGTGADLGLALVNAGAISPVIIAARDGLTDIEESLAARDIRATRIELYATRDVGGPLPPAALAAEAAFFASPSAVRALAARGKLNDGCALISLGPSTSAALRAAGLPVHAESRTRDLDGMLSALATLSPSQR